ncbi:MAG: hypothetical protein KGO49_03915 [Gammaproteobacteria bacterium]|nr:hypothetical protein [Gammaproteobacteria bacterium]
MPQTEWNTKQLQFVAAMQRYEGQSSYRLINKIVSWFNVSVQLFLMVLAIRLNIGWAWQIFAVLAAYVLADFVNGLVHLFMDHNDDYSSIVGPFVASFHLHHDIPRYTDKPLLQVYVDESGYKLWLVFFLLFLSGLFFWHAVAPLLLCIGAYFAVFSSIAEVSHYLCHNSHSRIVRGLQRFWILLPKKHHMLHHRVDNMNYAFLNGMSDPVINWIATHFYSGYKAKTDLHTALYQHIRHSGNVPASR